MWFSVHTCLSALGSAFIGRPPDCHVDLSLEKLVRRNRHDHVPRLWVDEISQREDHAVANGADHGHDRQEAEQAGHARASGGELTIESSNMFASPWQDSLATVSARVV